LTLGDAVKELKAFMEERKHNGKISELIIRVLGILNSSVKL